MQTSDGGSVHDPGATRPNAMWARPLVRTEHRCRGCASNGTKYSVGFSGGSVLVCRVCDGGPISVDA